MLAVYFCALVYVIESPVKEIIENVFPLLKIVSFWLMHDLYLLNSEAPYRLLWSYLAVHK